MLEKDFDIFYLKKFRTMHAAHIDVKPTISGHTEDFLGATFRKKHQFSQKVEIILNEKQLNCIRI